MPLVETGLGIEAGGCVDEMELLGWTGGMTVPPVVAEMADRVGGFAIASVDDDGTVPGLSKDLGPEVELSNCV